MNRVENHWLDRGERRMKRVDVYDVTLFSYRSEKEKSILPSSSRNIGSLSISLGDLSLRWRVLPSIDIYIYSPFIVIDTLINQESDGPTSNHHFLRVASGGAGVCARVLLCRSARELLVGRSDVSFWFLFRIKSRQFNSPRPRRRTF